MTTRGHQPLSSVVAPRSGQFPWSGSHEIASMGSPPDGPSGPLPRMSAGPSVETVATAVAGPRRRAVRRPGVGRRGRHHGRNGVGIMSNRPVMGRPMTRRTFIRAAGAAGAGFVLYAYLPGGTRQALAEIPGGDLNPCGAEVRDATAHPAGHAAGGASSTGRQAGGLLRDLHAAVRAADPSCRTARDDGLGLRRCGVDRASEAC